MQKKLKSKKSMNGDFLCTKQMDKYKKPAVFK